MMWAAHNHLIARGMASHRSSPWGHSGRIPKAHFEAVSESDGSKAGTTASSIMGSDDSMLGLGGMMGLGVSGMNPGQGIDNLQG